MGLLDGLKRYGEPGLSLLTGAVAEPVAGWAGLLSGNGQNVANVRNMLTYQPRPGEGQEGQNALVNAMMAAYFLAAHSAQSFASSGLPASPFSALLPDASQ